MQQSYVPNNILLCTSPVSSNNHHEKPKFLYVRMQGLSEVKSHMWSNFESCGNWAIRNKRAKFLSFLWSGFCCDCSIVCSVMSHLLQTNRIAKTNWNSFVAADGIALKLILSHGKSLQIHALLEFAISTLPVSRWLLDVGLLHKRVDHLIGTKVSGSNHKRAGAMLEKV